MLADQIHHSSEYHQAEIFPEGQFVTKHWIFFQWTRLLVPWWLKWLPKTIHWCWKVGTWVGHIHPLPSQRVSDEILRNRIGSILEVEFPNVATFLVNNTQRNGYLEPFWHLTYFECGLKGVFGINIWRTSMVLSFKILVPKTFLILVKKIPSSSFLVTKSSTCPHFSHSSSCHVLTNKILLLLILKAHKIHAPLPVKKYWTIHII